jgi:hypothetical protein
MFRNTILAVVAAAAVTVAPELGTSNADAHPPAYCRPVYRHPVYCRPVVVRPVYCAPVVVRPVYVQPVCVHYEVFYRPNCNAPWVCGGNFESRYAAEGRVGYYHSQHFESYMAVR